MKRLWARILQLLLAVVIVLYLGDWIGLRVRAQTTSTVQVQQFLRTPLKGQKEEFDYMGTYPRIENGPEKLMIVYFGPRRKPVDYERGQLAAAGHLTS